MTDSLSDDDRSEIAELSARYARAVDRRDFDGLAEVFCADGVLDSGRGVRRGTDEIAAAVRSIERYDETSHRIGMQQIEEARDGGARGVVSCEAHHVRSAADGSRSDYVMQIRYHDRYRRTETGWRIAERRLVTTRTETIHVD